MTYTPSESEKNCATVLQAFSIFLFFLPGLIVRRTHWWKSPYIRFWAKANLIWSVFLFIPIMFFFLLDFLVNTNGVFIVVWSIHAIMVIMCSFAAMFNRPVGYFIITNRYCLREMADVYGAAMPPGGVDESDDSDVD